MKNSKHIVLATIILGLLLGAIFWMFRQPTQPTSPIRFSHSSSERDTDFDALVREDDVVSVEKWENTASGDVFVFATTREGAHVIYRQRGKKWTRSTPDDVHP